MKQRSILGLEKRDELVNELVNKYKCGNAERVTILTGAHGCGKSYVINKVMHHCQNNKSENKIYTYKSCGDSFIQPDGHDFSTSITDFSISAGNSLLSLGLGIGMQKDNTQINLVKRMLDKVKKHTILICIDDFTNSNSIIRGICSIILNNIERIELELSEKIFFLISDSQESFICNFIDKKTYIEHILFKAYTQEDIINYLKKSHLKLKIDDTFRNNLLSIEKLCNGNLALIDFLFVDITIQNNDFFDALEKIVNHRMEQIKEIGKSQNISMSEMEDIILSSSLSLQKFSANEISSVTQRDNNIVATGFDIARENVFFDKDFECYYDFHCSEIKSILYKESLYKRKERVLSYYQYYTSNEPDEYYFRAYYLIIYSNKITSQAFSLLALALIYGNSLNDYVGIEKINKLIKEHGNTELISKINYIDEFYNMISSDNSTPDSIYTMYKKIKDEKYELPLQAEITRACFYYMYCKCSPHDERINILLNNCIQFVQNQLCLSNFNNPVGLKQTDESIIRLNIIYTIAPYLIDVKNDIEEFDKIYKLSISISQKGLSNKNVGIAQYIENVFNRKAFLFVNQTQCDVYYEKAKSYFFQHQIWDELCMTLICQAGTNIVIQQFEEAKSLCNQASDIISKYNIVLPKPAKLQNNLLIAEFLSVEKSEKNEKKRTAKTRQIIKKLKMQLNNIPCATEYVILTNLCSLNLYIGDDISYLKYKNKLQKLMKCIDVSDVNDENIDDFYRYYFAWYEAFRMLKNGDWEKARAICISLSNFIPSLFKKQEIFWEKKYQALVNLIDNHIQISAYDFCVNLVKVTYKENTLSKFFFRGLMISDLQYTSYI